MAVLVEDITAGIGGANVETNAGATKSGLRWVIEVVAAEVTDKNKHQRLPKPKLGHQACQKTKTNQECPQAGLPSASLRQY